MPNRRPWARQQQRWQAFLEWLGIRKRTYRRRNRLSITGQLGEKLEYRWMLSGSPPHALNNTYFVTQGTSLDVAGVLPAVDPVVYLALNGSTDELHGSTATTQGDTQWSSIAPPGLTSSLSLDSATAGSVTTDSINTDPQAITVAAWIRPTHENNSLQAIVTQETSNALVGLYLSDYNNGLSVRAPGVLYYYDAIPPVDRWTHVTATYEQSTQQVQLYINGQLWSQPPVADLSVLASPTSGATISAPLVIGSDQAGNTFSGQIAGVGWWNSALTATQAESLAESPSVLADDTDAEHDSLSAVVVNQVTHGTLDLHANGTFSYTPTTGFHGTDSFTYVAYDGSGSSAPATVSLIVQGGPTVTLPASAQVDEDTPLAITGLQIDHSDDATLSVTFSVLHGTLSVPTNVSGGLVADQVVGNGSAQLLLVGSVDEIANTLEAASGLVYLPDANYTGDDTLSVIADDETGSSPLGTMAIAIDPVQDAPLAVLPSSFNAIEDEISEIDDLEVDDVDSEVVAVVLAVTHGELTLATNVSGGVTAGQVSGNGSASVTVTGTVSAINTTLAAVQGVTYCPAENYYGSDELTMTTEDVGIADPTSNVGTLAFTVTATNDAPYITVPNASLAASHHGAVSVTGISLSDIDAGQNDVQVTLQVAHGSLTLNTTVNDGISSSQISNNGFGVVSVTGTLAAINATLAAGNGLSYQITAGYTGTDSVILTINDLGQSGGAAQTDIVGITISSANQPPENTLPTTFSGDEDTTVWLSGIAISDVDTQGSDVVVTLSVLHGSLTLASTVSGGVSSSQIGSNGTTTIRVTAPLAVINTTLAVSTALGYLASQNYSGTDALTMTTNDLGSGGTDPMTDIDTGLLTINSVNDAPINSLPSSMIATEDTTITISGLAVSDVDPAGNPLQVTLSVLHGSLTINSTVSGGVPSGQIIGNGESSVALSGTASQINTTLADASGVRYLAAANYDSTDHLTMLTNDLGHVGLGGALTDTDTVSLSVTSVNDPPTNQLPASFGGDEDNIIWMTGLSVSDVDAGSQNVWVTLSVQHGSLTLDTTVSDGLVGSQVSGNGTATLTMTGSSLAINTTLATAHGLGYQATADYAGTDALQMLTNDLGHVGGAALTDSDSAAVTVTAVNDGPSFSTGSNQTVSEDSEAQSTTAWATSISAGPSHESTQSLSFIVTNSNTGLFSVQPAIGSDGTLTYTPAANANGSAVVTVQIHDNGGTANGGVDTSATQTFLITVTEVNDAPSGDNDSLSSVLEDSAPLTISFASLLANDSTGPANESNQSLTISSVGNAMGGTVAISGTNVIFTPTANYNGSASFSYTLQDNGTTNGNSNPLTHTAGVNLTITAVNDVPSFTMGTNQTVGEDAGPQTVTGWATSISTDPSNESTQTPTFSVSNSNSSLFSVQPTINSSGVLSYTPATNVNGSAVVTVQLQDNGGTANGGVDTSASQTFSITVTAVNDTPSFSKGANQSVLEDAGAQSASAWATAMLAGPSDESTQTLNFIVSNDNSSLFSVQPALDATGKMAYTPAANANGTAIVTVQIHDNGGTANGGTDTSASQTFVITVTAVDDIPSFTKGTNQSVNEDAGTQSVSGWATAISTGPSNESTQTVSFNVSNNNNALFSSQPAIGSNGTLTYTPAANANGSAVVTVSISDNGGTGNGGVDTSATQTFSITVNAVNDAPVYSMSASEVADEDTAVSLSGISLSDVDAGSSTVSGTLSVAHGILTLASTVSSGLTSSMIGNNGSALVTFTSTLSQLNTTLAAANGLRYLAASNYNGTEKLTLTANDLGNSGSGGAQITSSTLAVTVNAINDAPSVTVPGASIMNPSTSTAITGISLTDMDAGSNNVQITLTALHGSLTLLSTVSGGITSGQMSSNGSATVIITAPLSAINTTLANSNGLKYLGSSSYSGSDTLTLSINDLGNTDYRGTSAALTSSGTVGITLLASGFSLSGTTLSITGGTGADALTTSFPTSNSITTTLNGTSFTFGLSQVSTVSIDLGSGTDSATINGLAGVNDTANLYPYSRQSSSFTSSSYTITLANSENITFNGQDGLIGDTAYFYDSTGNDTFISTPTSSSAILQIGSTGFYLRANYLGTMYATGGSGSSSDTAKLFDSAGNDTLYLSAATAAMSYLTDGSTYRHNIQGFANITGYRTTGGTDIATFTGAPLLADHFDAFPSATTSSSYSRMWGTGYDNRAYGFTKFTATGDSTDDVANFYAAASVTDTFSGTPNSAYSTATAFLTSNYYSFTGSHFKTVYTWGNSSDSDIMNFYGTAGVNDTFSGVPGSSSSMTTPGGCLVNSLNFVTIHVWSNAESGDSATVWDASASNDTFQGLAGDNFSSMVYYGNYVIQMLNFYSVTAISTFGGLDVAFLTGSSGVESLVLSGSSATMTFSGGRTISTYGFATLWANPGTGSDTTRSGTYAGTYYGAGVWA